MKTFKLSSLLLLCLVLLFSCSKDDSIQTSSESNPLQPLAKFGVNGQGGGNQNVVAEVAPTLMVVFNPDPAIVGQSMTVTGKFNPAAGETVPTCGKLQLQQNVNGTWVDLGTSVNVSSTITEVSAPFTPTIAGTGVYEFRVHYVAQNCAGYKQNKSDGFLLDVINQCSFNLTGSATGHAVDAEPGMYEFTLTYTMNTCELVFDKLKIQGGLTNGSTLISTSGGTNQIPGSSTNQTIKWEEYTPGVAIASGVKTYTIVFKKAYSGTGPITLTGNWAASLNMNGVSAGNAEFAPIIFEL
jgi:hypothetical protein